MFYVAMRLNGQNKVVTFWSIENYKPLMPHFSYNYGSQIHEINKATMLVAKEYEYLDVQFLMKSNKTNNCSQAIQISNALSRCDTESLNIVEGLKHAIGIFMLHDI